MTTPLGTLIIYARDMQKTAAFYSEHFGFQTTGEVLDGLIELRATNGGAGILIHQAAKSVKLGLESDGYQGVFSGTSYMHVGTWEGKRLMAQMLVANGQSADPASPHRDDQLKLFATKTLYQPPFSESEMAADPHLKKVQLRARLER